jgi:DNA-binding CsgD family transcriptional regulator
VVLRQPVSGLAAGLQEAVAAGILAGSGTQLAFRHPLIRLRYWLGQWDDALAELGSDAADSPGLMYSFLRERWSALLIHGVSALIAGRRDQRAAASQQLRKGLALPIENVTDLENRDFLVRLALATGDRQLAQDAAWACQVEGWAALTPTEVKVAALVARGDSTSDIARSLYLSRRIVQTYISRILTKLDAKSRVEIVAEALRRGVSP